MAYINFNKLWENYFDNIVSTNDKIQNMKINQIKLKLDETYKKDERVTANSKPSNDKDVINKAYLDEKLSNIEGHWSLLKKDYNEIKLLTNKQSM